MNSRRKEEPMAQPVSRREEKNFITLPVPKIMFRKITLTHILVAFLIIASYLIGMLHTKVSYLEKGGTGITPKNNVAAAAVPTAAAGPASIAPGQKVNVGVGHLPAQGDEKAKVTIVEFADFRCPFCEQVFKNVEPQLKKDYIDTGKVKLYFRHYAFLGPASTLASNAAECANDQGKFWDMYQYLYQNQPPETDTSMYTVDKMTDIAGQLGMDTGKFRDCLSTNKFDANVTKDMTEGQAAGTSATPTFYVNGIQLVGAQPYSAFKTLIDQELAK